MRRLIGVLALLTTLAAMTGAALARPAGFTNFPLSSGNPPVTEGGITTFHIKDRRCDDRKDSRGESDCINGNVRSMYGTSRVPRLGEAIEYRFDILIDPTLDYEGYSNPDSAGFEADAWDTHLRLAHWEGPLFHNFMFALKVSARAGITFLGKQCQSPDKFGEWVSFRLNIKWANDDKGWIVARCDDRVIYADEGVATNQAPHCYVQNDCEPGIYKDPQEFYFSLGVVMGGWGHTWQEIGRESQFVTLPERGITVKMRNMAVRDSGPLYGPVEKGAIAKLQARLNELGCDVGTADGVAGKRTRLAALTCRAFPDGRLPSKLTLATLPEFVRLYEQPEAADLPAGELPAEPPRFRMAEVGTESKGRLPHVGTTLAGRMDGTASPIKRLEFHVMGRYDEKSGLIRSLAILPDFDLRDYPAVFDCDAVYRDKRGSGEVYAVLNFRLEGNKYVIGPMDCVLNALPANAAASFGAIARFFPDIARSMVSDGTVRGVSHEGLRDFLRKVATGEVEVIAE